METIRKTIYDIDLAKQLQRIYSGVMLAKNDKKANRMGANVFQDGQAVNLSGYTVKGYFIRSGVETLVLTGAIDGNTAYVDLDAKCYHRDGSFSLSIVLCRDGKEQTLVIFDGRVLCTCTDTVVENENTLSLADIAQQEWVQNVLNAADTAMEQAGKAAASAVEAQNILDAAAAEAKAIVDSIPPDYSETVAELSKKAPAIFVDASGEMVHITDGAAMPVQSLVTHIAPVQSGSGDPSPDNVRPISGWDSVSASRAGKNLLPYLDLSGERNGITFASNNDGTYVVDGTATADAFYRSNTAPISLGVLPAGQYTVSIAPVDASQKVRGRVTNKTGNTSAGTTSRETGAVTFTADGVSEYGFGFFVGKGVTVEQLTVSFQIEHGESATVHEQYQGQTLTAALPETVYGGVLDWTTGVLTVDRAVYTVSGMESWSKNETSGRLQCEVQALYQSAGTSAGANTDVFCSHDKTAIATNRPGVWVVPATSGKIGLRWLRQENDFTDVEALKSYLSEQYAAGTPMQYVYKIATHYTIQLTPQQLSTLKGVNNIWSDAGQTEVTYAADTKMYADGKDSTAMIGTAEPGMIATKNYASGDFIVVGKSLYKATAAIATGEAITPGTNCTATTVIEQLAAIYNLIK